MTVFRQKFDIYSIQMLRRYRKKTVPFLTMPENHVEIRDGFNGVLLLRSVSQCSSTAIYNTLYECARNLFSSIRFHRIFSWLFYSVFFFALFFIRLLCLCCLFVYVNFYSGLSFKILWAMPFEYDSESFYATSKIKNKKTGTEYKHGTEHTKKERKKEREKLGTKTNEWCAYVDACTGVCVCVCKMWKS